MDKMKYLYVNGDIHSTGTVHNDEVSGKRIEATEQLKTLHFHINKYYL